nr:MAG TPA: hypothetical protein [Caudoviricetes sp.]
MKLTKLKEAANVVTLFASEHRTSLMVGGGIAGMVIAGVTAVRVTPKASMLLEERRCSKHDAYLENTEANPQLTIKDYIQVTWKYYLPPIALATVSAGAIIFAHKVDRKENAALAAAYAISESRLKEYSEKVLETVGEKKEKEVRNAIDKDRVNNNQPVDGEIISTGQGDTLCMDAWNGRYFYSDIEVLRRAAVDLSRAVLNDETVTLNDFYDRIDLPQTKNGDFFAWEIGNHHEMIELSFSSQLDFKKRPVLVMDFKFAPTYYDREPW